MHEGQPSNARPNHQRIDVAREQECRYWSEKLGVSPERLRRAVKEVGPLVEDVKRHLGK